MTKAKINLNVEAEKDKENICPKCKKGILVVTSSRGVFNMTIFKSFCPVCGHTISRMI